MNIITFSSWSNANGKKRNSVNITYRVLCTVCYQLISVALQHNYKRLFVIRQQTVHL